MNENLIKVPGARIEDTMKVLRYLISLGMTSFAVKEEGDFFYIQLDEKYTGFHSRKKGLLEFLVKFKGELIHERNSSNGALQQGAPKL